MNERAKRKNSGEAGGGWETLPVTFGDRMVTQMQGLGDMQVHAVVYPQGKLDISRVRHAVWATVTSVPILSCRLSKDHFGGVWKRRESVRADELFSTEELPSGAGPQKRDEAVRRYLALPSDPAQDPLLQARLICGGESAGDALCLKLNHLAGDGGAGKDALYLVSRYYEQGAQGSPDGQGSSPVSSRPPPRGLEVLFRHLTLSQRLQALAHTARDGGAMVSPPRYWNMATPGSREARRWAQRDYVLHRFDPEETHRLRRRAKALGATLNDLFLAAYGLALEQVLPPRGPNTPLRLRMTVDLRRYLPSRRAPTLCNLSGFSYLNLGRVPLGLPLSQLVDVVRRETQRQKRGVLGLTDWTWTRPLQGRGLSPVVDRAVGWVFAHPELPLTAVPSLTNIGPIDTARVQLGGVAARDAFLTASVIYPPLLAPALTGFGDRLTLSVGFCDTGKKHEASQATPGAELTSGGRNGGGGASGDGVRGFVHRLMESMAGALSDEGATR